MGGRNFRSFVVFLCVALFGSAACEPEPVQVSLEWGPEHEQKEGKCPSEQILYVTEILWDDSPLSLRSVTLTLRLWIKNEQGQWSEVQHSSTLAGSPDDYMGSFTLTVGETLPRDSLRDGLNVLTAAVTNQEDQSINSPDGQGMIYVSDCDEEQPVSDLKAEFHFGKTSGCPFMQVVDVAGVADNADVSLKLSIDGTSVDNTAEFITEGEYVEEGFDGYFDLVAGDDFDAALEGEHTLKVEVSDGVGSVEIEGKFTADSC